MNEPQVWTLIGVFAAALFGMLTLMSTMFLRVLRTEIGSVRTEIGSVRNEIGSVRNEMDSVRNEIGALRGEMNSGLSAVRTEIRRVEDVMTTRFEHLDRDVSAISRRVFPDPPAA